MTYIPYRTTIPSGDILRNPNDTALIIGEQENKLVESKWRTGYTQQNYNLASTVTIQTNALANLNDNRNKLTPATLDFSAKPRGAS